jgi:hypothetical protein
VISSAFLGFLLVSSILTHTLLSSLTYVVLLVLIRPVVPSLFAFLRHCYLSQLQDLPADNPIRIRSLPEVLHILAAPLRGVWAVYFFVSHTFSHPNTIDTLFLVVTTLNFDLLTRIISPFALAFVGGVAILAAPAVLARTPAREFVKKLVENRAKAKAE